MSFIPTATTRHAELVSASIFQQQLSVYVARWTLNQVQGDGFGGVICSKKILTANRAVYGTMLAKLVLVSMEASK